MTTQAFKVLIADNNQSYRNQISEIVLYISKFEILDKVDDGEKLIQSYFNNNSDLIITDISLPLKSGFEVFKEIQAVDKDVKFLFTSSDVNEFMLCQIYRSGGAGYIKKSMLCVELEHALKMISKGKIFYGRLYPENKIKEILEEHWCKS